LRAVTTTLEEPPLQPKNESWTPYGLEPIRIQHLRRRRFLAILAVLALLVLAVIAYQVTTRKQSTLEIFANGNQVGGDIQIETPEAQAKKDHQTVELTPGNVTDADTGSDAPTSTLARESLPTFSRAQPYDWTAYLIAYGPYLLVILAGYWLAKKRGKFDEINFGVYKGAMPLEMITASHEKTVFTRRRATSSVFGKGRLDHVPREVALAELAVLRGPDERDLSRATAHAVARAEDDS